MIKDFLNRNKGHIGIRTELANAAGCKLSYLSHVLNEKAQFTMDHAFGVARFMKLNPPEHQFFLLLVQQARSASREYQDYLREQIEMIKSDHFKIEKEIDSSSTLTASEYEIYAGDWLYQAVHIYLTVPKFQNFDALREQLHVSAEQLREVLEGLARIKLAKYDERHALWHPIMKDMHAPLSSTVATHRHAQWKMRSIFDMQRKQRQSVHYGATFSLSKADFDKIKSELLIFIRSNRDVALKSGEEMVSHLDISFFEV